MKKGSVTQSGDYPAIPFDDIIEASRKLKALGIEPIDHIKTGKKLFTKISKTKVNITRRMGLGSLYGVKFVLDEDLEPNEYKIVKSKQL